MAFSVGIGSMLARAQSADDVDALTQQVQQLKHAGKYADTLLLQRRKAAQIEKTEAGFRKRSIRAKRAPLAEYR
jgi:hypothetical protein